MTPTEKHIEELERVNAEMLEALIYEYKLADARPSDRIQMKRLKPVIESATGKTIEEATK